VLVEGIVDYRLRVAEMNYQWLYSPLLDGTSSGIEF
jgi:hypothetical protein